MTTMTFLFSMTMAAAIIFALAAHILPKRNSDGEKSSPYECGFDPLNSARLPFSFRFFLVAMLFLLFDLEIALLFPLPAATLSTHPHILIPIALMFMIMLALGLIFEWMNGGLEWAE